MPSDHHKLYDDCGAWRIIEVLTLRAQQWNWHHLILQSPKRKGVCGSPQGGSVAGTVCDWVNNRIY